MSEQIKLIVAGIVRTLFVAIGGYLVRKGLIDQTVLSQYATPEVALGVVTVVGGILWSIYNKLRGINAVRTALMLPPRSGHAEVEHVLNIAKERPISLALTKEK